MEKVKTPFGLANGTNAGSRAALEALFAPKKKTTPPPAPRSSKIVSLPTRADDPQRALREKLLAKLLGAEGSVAVGRAAVEYAGAGFAFPDGSGQRTAWSVIEDQRICLKLLDHPDEDRVRDAMAALGRILTSSTPHRTAVLAARLRRIESDAEELATREQATTLRRTIPRES